MTDIKDMPNLEPRLDGYDDGLLWTRFEMALNRDPVATMLTKETRGGLCSALAFAVCVDHNWVRCLTRSEMAIEAVEVIDHTPLSILSGPAISHLATTMAFGVFPERVVVQARPAQKGCFS